MKISITKTAIFCVSVFLTLNFFYCCQPVSSVSAAVVKAQNFSSKSGLLVISKGSDGEKYAKQIANEKKWRILLTESKDHSQIKTQISDVYKEQKFDYLLIIGTNDEIPFAVYDRLEKKYKTDPSLYADINDDGFIELAVGRLPFSSQEQLEEYFSDLLPKGDAAAFEHYPLVLDGQDPYDSSTVKNFSDAQALESLYPQAKAYKNTNISDLVGHYRQNALLELRAHGGTDSIAVDEFNYLNIFSFCEDFRERTSSNDAYYSCSNREYLDNRPIIIHLSCSNGASFGKDLIENGASAFLGFYNQAGYVPSPGRYLLAGKSIGEALVHVYNVTYSAGIFLTDTQGKSISVSAAKGFNSISSWADRTDDKFDHYGFILYGDPSIVLPKNFKKMPKSIKNWQKNNKIIFNAYPPTTENTGPQMKVVHYSSELVHQPSYVFTDYWSGSHEFRIFFPVKNVENIKSVKAFLNGRKIFFDINEYDYGFTLIRGRDLSYIYARIASFPLQSNAKYNGARFDYTKKLQIQIIYE